MKGMNRGSLADMTISKPVYFLMLILLVLGLALMSMNHFVLNTNELDWNMLSDLDLGSAVDSMLNEGNAGEELSRITDFFEKHTENGEISVSVFDMYSLMKTGYIRVAIMVLYIAAITIAMIPLFVNCGWKVYYLIPANLAPVVAMAALMAACVKLEKILAPALRTTSLIVWVIVSVMTLLFAFCLIVNMMTTENKKM